RAPGAAFWRVHLVARRPPPAHALLRVERVRGIRERRGGLLHRIGLVRVVAPGAPADPGAPAAAAPLPGQAAVDKDPVEPGRELRLPGKRAGRLVEPDEGVLRAILGFLAVAHDRPRDAIGPLLVALDQEIEGSRFPLRHRAAQVFIARLHGRPSARSSHTGSTDALLRANTSYPLEFIDEPHRWTTPVRRYDAGIGPAVYGDAS